MTNPTLEIFPDADNKIPSFVGKLFAMLGDVRCNKHIYWSSRGDGIVIPDPEQFASRVLPR
jgi:hypothetical protein